MRQLLNTLFITSEDIYAALEGENIVLKRDGKEAARYPLHALQGIVCFSYLGASPALMGACAEKNILLAFCRPNGRFLCRTAGATHGNVLLRRAQYRLADDPRESTRLAGGFVFGKIYNARSSLERTRRDHELRIDSEKFMQSSLQLKGILETVPSVWDPDTLRGLEGAAATVYFNCLDDMILGDKEAFFFHGRNRRPPLDRVNALLSFAYSLLSGECASALEAVGLDAYVGFLHRDRPGRNSMAQDLIEELRPCLADRFVLTLINNRMVSARDFEMQESGAVYLCDDARRTVLRRWQERKKEVILHPFLKEKIPWGLIPYVQALLLSRYIRGDLDAYPPFLWK